MDSPNSESSSSQSQSVTEWLNDLKLGDPAAAQQILDRYMSQLIRVANRKLGKLRRRVADEEDVVSVAFASFLKRVDLGGFSKLDDRNDLWQILLVLTDRKAVDLIRHESALIRGNGQLFGESILENVGESQTNGGIDAVTDRQPSPEYAAILIEEFSDRLSMLNSEQRKIAVDKMDGFTNQEIANRRGIKLRTVERRLGETRDVWQNQ